MTDINSIFGSRKLGSERFRDGNQELNFSLLDFWQWSNSELLSNTLRGLLAEYIVAVALECHENLRPEWNLYDLKTPEGVTVEVKSSAYVQNWKQKKESVITFRIAPKKGWNADTDEYFDKPKRRADVYVFCILKHRDRETIDPLDLNQWDFYVLSTSVLNEKKGNQKDIRLNPLLLLSPTKVGFSSLREAVLNAAGYYTS